MSKLFIVIKVKGQKKPLGAIPASRKATKAQLKTFISKRMGTNFCATIATEAQVKRLLLKIRKMRLIKRKRKR